MINRLNVTPIILIILGVLLLLKNFGFIETSVWKTIGKLWPLLLIIIGIRILFGTGMFFGSHTWCKSTETQTLALGLGNSSQADVRVSYGAGTLSIGTAAQGKILDGTFIGGVTYDVKDGSVRLSNPRNHLNWMGWCDKPRSEWRVGITREVPLNLHVDVGAAESDLDLSELKLINFQLNTGASSTIVRFPRAAGLTTASISAGAASVKLIIPEGVAARIQTTMAVGSTDINHQRFPMSAGAYMSPDYATATNKIDITFKGGVGSLQIS